MGERRIRVLLVDDHAIVRKGLRALLASEAGVEVVGEAGNGSEAIQATDALSPEVILMDLVMPKMDGIEATRAITEQWPGTRILVLTSFAGDDKVFPAIKAGALGYLLKDSTLEELVAAIAQVAQGEPCLGPGIARKVLNELANPPRLPLTREPLTEREVGILRLLAQGYSNKEIAGRLMIAEMTVRTHVSNILSKLQLASRTQAALYALKEGLASLDDYSPPSV